MAAARWAARRAAVAAAVAAARRAASKRRDRWKHTWSRIPGWCSTAGWSRSPARGCTTLRTCLSTRGSAGRCSSARCTTCQAPRVHPSADRALRTPSQHAAVRVAVREPAAVGTGRPSDGCCSTPPLHRSIAAAYPRGSACSTRCTRSSPSQARSKTWASERLAHRSDPPDFRSSAARAAARGSTAAARACSPCAHPACTARPASGRDDGRHCCATHSAARRRPTASRSQRPPRLHTVPEHTSGPRACHSRRNRGPPRRGTSCL